MNVSLYVHGMISFGAIVGGMIATSGDEAFVMLTQFPGTALLLFGLLFGCGILFAWISDKVIGLVGFAPCESCLEQDCAVCLAGMENDEGLDEILYPMNLRKNIKSLSFTRFLSGSGLNGNHRWNRLELEAHHVYLFIAGFIIHFHGCFRVRRAGQH